MQTRGGAGLVLGACLGLSTWLGIASLGCSGDRAKFDPNSNSKLGKENADAAKPAAPTADGVPKSTSDGERDADESATSAPEDSTGETASEVDVVPPTQTPEAGVLSACEQDTDCPSELPNCVVGACECALGAEQLASDDENCGDCGHRCADESPNAICQDAGCVVLPDCGDGVVEGTEQCDPPNDVDCNATCTKSVCGNGALEDGEACDDANRNNADECSATCQVPECGNSVVEGSEGCDDGNDVEQDGCTNACALASCGDGSLQGIESCDPPDGVSCGSACQLIECGDGVAEGEEQCDDGNAIDADACGLDCAFTCAGGAVPLATDRCDVVGDDSDCNGQANEGCTCLLGAKSTCGVVRQAQGACAAIELVCGANGKWPAAASCQSQSAELCNNDGKDENCDGDVNEGCDCVVGETASCAQLYDAVGDCGQRLLGCAANGHWPAASECLPGPSDQDCDPAQGTGGGGASFGGGFGSAAGGGG